MGSASRLAVIRDFQAVKPIGSAALQARRARRNPGPGHGLQCVAMLSFSTPPPDKGDHNNNNKLEPGSRWIMPGRSGPPFVGVFLV
jgi:hypothetical protein